ncbi:MAG TPA: hypothetical protein PKY31_05375 [Spirochaetota bacterium]|nr:hypothetical protein [Spirochaetota bacterium]
MDEITFSYNWNNKLDCKAFTTIRLHNPYKYRVGSIYRVGEVNHDFTVKIIDIKVIPFGKINEYMARIDTGYSLEECKNIMRKMYADIEDSTKIDFILLCRVDAEEQRELNFNNKERS